MFMDALASIQFRMLTRQQLAHCMEALSLVNIVKPWLSAWKPLTVMAMHPCAIEPTFEPYVQPLCDGAPAGGSHGAGQGGLSRRGAALLTPG